MVILSIFVHFFALKLRSSGCSHGGFFFTNKEQKERLAHDVTLNNRFISINLVIWLQVFNFISN